MALQGPSSQARSRATPYTSFRHFPGTSTSVHSVVKIAMLVRVARLRSAETYLVKVYPGFQRGYVGPRRSRDSKLIGPRTLACLDSLMGASTSDPGGYTRCRGRRYCGCKMEHAAINSRSQGLIMFVTGSTVVMEPFVRDFSYRNSHEAERIQRLKTRARATGVYRLSSNTLFL